MEKLTKAKSTLAQQAASDPAVAALVTATEFALKDMAIQKQRAEQGSLDDRVKMVDELSAFLESHDGQGVFVLGGRLSKDKLMKAYGAVAGK
jgi:hypothetical protein